MNAADHEAWMRREMDQLREEVGNCRADFVKQGSVLGDAQTRLAVLESKQTVSRDEYEPVKRIVWGMVGLILTIVMAALLAIAVVKPINVTSVPTISGPQAHP